MYNSKCVLVVFGAGFSVMGKNEVGALSLTARCVCMCIFTGTLYLIYPSLSMEDVLVQDPQSPLENNKVCVCVYNPCVCIQTICMQNTCTQSMCVCV